jgi:hypothetical protein
VDEETRKELIRLLELDYDRATSIINGITGISGTIRGLAITVWVAAVGFASQQRSWPLGLLAAALVVVFAVVDGYHAWIYAEALRHAQEIESVELAYYVALTRGVDDPGMREESDLRLQTFEIGTYGRLRVFKWRDIWYVQPRILFVMLYPAMAAAAIVEAILISAH